MADDKISVQPASPAPAAPPVGVKVLTVPSGDGVSQVVIQAVCLLNEFGRPVTPMSEATGQDLLAAIKALTAALTANAEGLTPSTSGLVQS